MIYNFGTSIYVTNFDHDKQAIISTAEHRDGQVAEQCQAEMGAIFMHCSSYMELFLSTPTDSFGMIKISDMNIPNRVSGGAPTDWRGWREMS